MATALSQIINDEHIEQIAELTDKKRTANESALIKALGFSRNWRARETLQRAVRRKSLAFYAIDAMGFLGDNSVVEWLIGILRKDNKVTSARAALALGRLKAHSSFAFLIEALRSENEDVRLFSAYALGKIGDRRAATPLMNIVRVENSADVQASAITALGELQTIEAAALIAPFLQHRNFSLRSATVRAMGELKQEELVKPHLPALLKDMLYQVA